MPDSVYKVIELVGTSTESWEKAATTAVEAAAQTLRDLGQSPHMTEATVIRQREVGALGLNIDAEDALDLTSLTDTILAGLAPKTPPTNEVE